MTAANGSIIVGIVVGAIAILVFALWRRSAGAEATCAVAGGSRTDSHAVDPAVAAPRPAVPSDVFGERALRVEERTPPERAPHPSGLGAAELAAIVEEGFASLRTDVVTFAQIVDSVGAASALPEDMPARPAMQQVALIDQMTAMIAIDLERASRLAATVAADVERGHEARSVVHGELARIGLPADFFVAMDTTAAALAVDLVRVRMAVDRLVRRFEALSSLYSGVRPTVGMLVDIDATLVRAAAAADSWRQADVGIDLVAHDPELVRRDEPAQPLGG